MTSEIRSKALRGQFDEKVNIAEPQSEVRKVGVPRMLVQLVVVPMNQQDFCLGGLPRFPEPGIE